MNDNIYPNRLEYLFGLYFEEKGNKIYKSFWAHNKDEEKEVLLIFLNLQMTILKNIQIQKFIIMRHTK